VVITYTTFPVVADREKEHLLPMLSDGFPHMDVDYKTLVDSEETNKLVAPKKKHALATAMEGAAVADATPLTVTKRADSMDVASDGEEDSPDDGQN